MPILKPSVLQFYPLADVKVHLWQLTETLDELCSLLPDSSILKEAPYSDFKSEKRKKEWVAIRVLLSRVCELPLSICYCPNGKPFLAPAVAEISISHTKEVVGLSFSSQSIGMDVEHLDPRPLRLVSQFLNIDDFNPFSVPYAELMATFMWSAKESVYKLVSIPELELKAHISLFPETVDEQYTHFKAYIYKIAKIADVYCYRLDTFVLTLAKF